jgi:hypothetical protein
MSRLFALCLALLAGCASNLTSVPGQNLAKGVVQPSPVAAAVRVGAKANLLHQGKRLKFDVWIEADSTRGRLDALGPFGTPLATVIWQDSSWKAWLPGQATLLRGSGSSVNLPVLGLKEINPEALVAPLLGRVLPRTGSVRAAAANAGLTLVLPSEHPPTWSLLIDKTTGLPQRRQTLLDGREVEGLSFHRWRKEGEILVPGTIDRTTPDGQLLQLELNDWSRIPSIPTEHLNLVLQSPIDTITLARNQRGQTVYRIRAVGDGGDSTSVVLSGSHAMLEAPVDDPTFLTGDDTLDQDDESEDSDSTTIEEESGTEAPDLRKSDSPAGDSKASGNQPSDKPKPIIPVKRARKP